jgi:hypothetical protein
VVATQDLKKEIAAEAFSLETRRNTLDNSKRLQVSHSLRTFYDQANKFPALARATGMKNLQVSLNDMDLKTQS